MRRCGERWSRGHSCYVSIHIRTFKRAELSFFKLCLTSVDMWQELGPRHDEEWLRQKTSVSMPACLAPCGCMDASHIHSREQTFAKAALRTPGHAFRFDSHAIYRWVTAVIHPERFAPSPVGYRPGRSPAGAAHSVRGRSPRSKASRVCPQGIAAWRGRIGRRPIAARHKSIYFERGRRKSISNAAGTGYTG